MIIGKYKKTDIYIWYDVELKRYFGSNMKNNKYTNLYESINELKDGLRINTCVWIDYSTHCFQLKKLLGVI